MNIEPEMTWIFTLLTALILDGSAAPISFSAYKSG